MQYQATQKHIDGRVWRPDLPLQLVTLFDGPGGDRAGVCGRVSAPAVS